MNLDQTYQIAADLKEKAARIKMRDFEWRFLFAFDGTKTAREIAADCHLDGPAATQLLLKLRQHALLVETEMSLDEFLAHNAMPGVPLVAADKVVPSSSPPEPAPTVPSVLPTPPTPITFSIRRQSAIESAPATKTAAALTSNRLVPVLASTQGDDAVKDSTAISRDDLSLEFSVKREKFKLKPVIDFIIDRAGGGTVGQLAVYRVFLKIPPPLLHAAKVNSLNLVTDDTEVDHPPFREAVLKSVKDTLGVSFPA